MVTVKTPFDCIKTNNPKPKNGYFWWSCEIFFEPLAKEKLTWNAEGCLTSPCPLPILFLLALCCLGPGVNTSTRFVIKNNPAKICLLVSVCAHLKAHSVSMWFMEKLYQGLCWHQGRHQQGNETEHLPGAGRENIAHRYCCRICCLLKPLP